MNNKIMSLSFGKDIAKPVEELDRRTGFIKWGKKNDYPFQLIDLYNSSAWHSGIIKNKTFYISGGGLEAVSGDLQGFIDNIFSDFNMNEVADRMAFDFEMFGGFAVKGTWNKEGTRVVRWEHINMDDLRISEDMHTFYLSDDWSVMNQSESKTNLRTIQALDEKNPQGTFIMFYKEPSKKYKGEKGIYPKPPYYGGVTAIQTDGDISKFHMYELNNGFKSGTLISMTGGIPESVEEENKIRDMIKGRSQALEDAGEIIITFSNGKDQAPEVHQLNGNDLDKRYEILQNSVQQNILVAHSITSPKLFGIIQEGSFNSAEALELFEIFKNSYIDMRQRRLEWMLNKMVELSGYSGRIKLKDVNPVNVKEETPEIKNDDFKFNDDDEIKVFAQFGADESDYNVIKSDVLEWETPEDEIIKRENFALESIGKIKGEINQYDKSVLRMLSKGEDGSSIAKALGRPLKEIAESIERLKGWEMIVETKVTDVGEYVLDKLPETRQFEVRYRYQVRPDAPPVKTKTREFCQKLIDLGRIYTREEINTISGRVSRDVWKFRGGWYHNPKTNVTTPYCRHIWFQELVIKK
tara:strand:+ start:577 stop:2316 length:1740 start_codon:yes stop_codon:yes gene_type:complete